jgi:hypothetical protein
MNLRNGSRTFSNCAANPFDGTGADVAHGKNSANVGFQRQEFPVTIPGWQVRAGPHESPVVEFHVAIA